MNRAAPIGNNDRLLILAFQQLIVAVDLISFLRSIEIAFGLNEGGLHEGCAHIFEIQAKASDGCRIHLNPHRGFLPASDAHQAA